MRTFDYSNLKNKTWDNEILGIRNGIHRPFAAFKSSIKNAAVKRAG